MDCVGGVSAASAAAYSVQLEGLLAFRKSVTTDPLVALSVHRSSNAARALCRGVRQHVGEFSRCVGPSALSWRLPAPPASSLIASASAVGELCRCVRPRALP
jgi:hypothetical protein